MIAARKVLALSAALGLLAASTARAVPPEPVEVRLLRTVHLGALQGLSEADLGRLSGPGESSYARSVLSRAALLVLGKPGPMPGIPVETLLDQALGQLKPGNELGRVAEVRDGRGARPLRFEHLYGCWRLVEP